MKKKKDEVTIRSSAAEYLTYVASVGDQQDSIERRYEVIFKANTSRAHSACDAGTGATVTGVE